MTYLNSVYLFKMYKSFVNDMNQFLPTEPDKRKLGSQPDGEPSIKKPKPPAEEPEDAPEAAPEAEDAPSQDTFDSPMDAEVVEIRLKHVWETHNFGHGFAKDKKEVAKIKDILAKKKIKDEFANWPAIVLRKWQDKQIKKKWKETRNEKPPQQFGMTKDKLKKWQDGKIREEWPNTHNGAQAPTQLKKTDPLVMKWRKIEPPPTDPLIIKWRSKSPTEPDTLAPAPEYIPVEDNQFQVENISDSFISVYVENKNDTGNFNMKHKAKIPVKYVEWRFIDILEDAPSDETVRFKAALDCLHTFGGGGVFTNDEESCKWLSQKDKELDKKLKFLVTKIGVSSDEYQNTKKESWDIYDPPLLFNPKFNEISYESLHDPSAVDSYIRDERNERQLKILTWSRYAAIKQLPVNTVLEIKFAGEPDWYRVKVVESSTQTQTVRYKYLNPLEDDNDWSDGYLDLVYDTFRIVRDRDKYVAADSSDSSSESSSDSFSDSLSDDEDTDYIGRTVVLTNGNTGVITAVRPRFPVDIDNPYEYEVNGVWYENIYTKDTELDYQIGDSVRCPDGKYREIKEMDDYTAYFDDEYSVYLSDLDEDGLTDASSDDDDETKEDKFDLNVVHNYQGRDVEILGKVYHKKGFGEDIFELVKLKFLDDGKEVPDVPLEDIDVEEIEEEESDSEIEEDDLEAMDEEQELDAAMSEDDELNVVHNYQGRAVKILGKAYHNKGVEMVKLKFLDDDKEMSDVPLKDINVEEIEEEESDSELDEDGEEDEEDDVEEEDEEEDDVEEDDEEEDDEEEDDEEEDDVESKMYDTDDDQN